MIRHTLIFAAVLTLIALYPTPSKIAPATTPQVVVQTPLQPADTNQNNAEEKQKERLVAYISSHYKKPRHQVSSIVEEVHDSSEQYDIDPTLFLALIAVESSFNPSATSAKGALGLSQVMPNFHGSRIERVRSQTGQGPTGIKSNILIGMEILSEYRKISGGDMDQALLRYNGSLRDPKRRYVSKVMTKRRLLEQVMDPDA